MNAYKCRPMEPGDRHASQALCEKAQQDYWFGIKTPIRWSLEVWERIEAMRPIVAVDADGKAVGFLLMALMTHWKPRTVKILGWATEHTLTDKERLCIGLSMLLHGYDECLVAGITQGVGSVERTNTPVVETLRLVESFRLDPEPTAMSLTAAHMYDVTVKVAPAYQRALKAAIRKL